MRNRLLLGLAALALGTALWGTSPAPAQPLEEKVSRGEQIVFVRDYQPWLMNPDGNEQRKILLPPDLQDKKCFRPRLSPDREWIVLNCEERKDKESRDLYKIQVDGTKLRNLTPDNPQGKDDYADISPDGEWIVYSSERNGQRDLWLMDAYGRQKRQLTNDPTFDITPAFSPDGKKIAYASGDFKTLNLWVMDLETGKREQLTETATRDWFPSWHPNGREIAYQRDDWKQRNSNLALLLLKEKRVIPLTQSGRGENSEMPSYSPNGRNIVFAKGRFGSNYDLVILASEEMNVFETAKKELHPHWR